MGSVINTNVAANSIHGIYTNNNNRMNAAMTRVATAQKINSAKDGGAIWSISEKMRERIRSNDQANQNVQNDTALLKTAEGGIGNTIDIIKTLKERAISAADDTNDESSRAVIANEVKQLLNGINDNASKVKFNGRTLLDGTLGTTASTSTATAAVTSKSVVEPTAATEGTATTTSATYFLSAGSGGNFRVLSNNAAATTNSVSDTKLTDLVNANRDSLIDVGDKITFSWKEDGKEQSYSINVASNTVFTDLGFEQGALKISYQKAATPLTDADGNKVLQANSLPASTTASTGLGLWAVGKEGVNISDLKVSITYLQDGEETTRATKADPTKYTQDAFKFEGQSQVSEGSQEVALLTVKATAAAVTTDTTLSNLLNGGSATDLIHLSVDGHDYTFNGSNNIQNVIDKLADDGIAVQFGDGNALVGADGKNVTRSQEDSGGNPVKFMTTTGGTTTNTYMGNLYFTKSNGEEIGEVSMNAYAADGTTKRTVNGTEHDGTALDNTTHTTLTSWQVQKLPPTEADPDTVKGLTFFVGGEQGFAMQNVDIASMKVNDLFGDSVQNISDLFKTGDGAQKAIGIIDGALQKALDAQTDVGALEMRLGYIGDNLTTMNENLQAADSTFRDADMAKEMTAYMKYAVLSQASQYMLAQASQNAYQVLNLLQS